MCVSCASIWTSVEVCRLHRHVHLRVLILTFALIKLRLRVVSVKLEEGEEGIRLNIRFLFAWEMFRCQHLN